MHYVSENRSYADIVQLLFGAVLFVTPWLFAFTGAGAAAWHAWIAGIVIAALAGASLASTITTYWVSWATLAVGLWAIVSPWVIGFAAVSAALWSHVVIGLLIAVLALVELAADHRGDSRVSA